MSPTMLPNEVHDFALLVLPPNAPINWDDPRIHEHLSHLAATIAGVHANLLTWRAGGYLLFFCTDLAEIGWALRPVLREQDRDAWIWRILSSIVACAGLRPRIPGGNGYIPGLFTANSATPTAIAAFFRTHFYWP